MSYRTRTAAALVAVALVPGCSSSGPNIPDGWSDAVPRLGGHVGAAVDGGDQGPARFVPALLDIFEVGGAMAIARDLDKLHRSPAGEGYEAAVDRVLADLYGAGFGADEGYQLDVLTSGMAQPAWTPVRAEIRVVSAPAEGGARGRRGGRNQSGGQPRAIALVGFSSPTDEQRVLLPVGAVGCEVSGPAAFSLEELTEGGILVTDRSIRNVEQDAAAKGAAAVVSWFQLPYCQDPTGKNRQWDAMFSGSVRPGSTLPSFYVSPRTAENMRVAASNGATFQLSATVRTEIKDLRTIVATIDGTDDSSGAVYVVSHVDGTGANDNAAGAGGVVEIARSIKRLIAAGGIKRPRRTLRFVLGQESEAGKIAMERMSEVPIAAIVADMIGTSYLQTGGVCLLERGWDPAAVVPLAPDVHTPWGAGEVVEEDIVPNGLSILLREALIDVGSAVAAKSKVPWPTREHPWEGGSDHDAFLAEGVAAALIWHFTDFSYSTSLDRIGHVDPEELRRTAIAIGAAAMSLADGQPGDLERHLDSLNLERRLRLEAVEASDYENKDALAELWKQWFDGARLWLRAITSGEALPEPTGLPALESLGR